MSNITTTKRVRVCLVGQSNERGRSRLFSDGTTLVYNSSQVGAPLSEPIAPNGGTTYGGAWWPYLSDLLYQHGVWFSMANTAVGATGLVQEWCGDSVGDGTGTPLNSGDGGFDPNSYLSDVLTNLDKGSFDEYWVFISSGQSDAIDNVSLANFQLAIENITNYFLTQTINNKIIKVAIGLSFNLPAETAWYANSGKPGMLAALSTFSSNSNVIAGADLYTSLGLYPELYDGIHGTDKANIQAAKAWDDKLIEGGW